MLALFYFDKQTKRYSSLGKLTNIKLTQNTIPASSSYVLCEFILADHENYHTLILIHQIFNVKR